MGREFDVARSALLASTVFAGGVALPIRADATPSSVVSILSALTLGTLNSGGIGASASGVANPVAVYVGDGSNGTATLYVSNNTAAPVTRIIGGSVVVGGTSAGDTRTSMFISGPGTLDISGGAIEFARSNLTAISGMLNALVVSGGTATSTTVTGGSALISAGQTTRTSYDSGGGVVLSANVSGAASSLINVAKTVSNIVTSGLAGGAASNYIDVTVNGSGNGTGVGGITVTSGGIGTGRQQFIVVDVTSELTTALTLSAENSSDYFFVYLTSGIGAGGAITTGSADGVTPSAANIITIIGQNPTDNMISGTQQGTFIDTASGTAKVAGTIDGGIFMADASTSASELMLIGGAVISANAWNGYFAASTNEPASMAALATGALALGAARRRKRRNPT